MQLLLRSCRMVFFNSSLSVVLSKQEASPLLVKNFFNPNTIEKHKQQKKM